MLLVGGIVRTSPAPIRLMGTSSFQQSALSGQPHYSCVLTSTPGLMAATLGPKRRPVDSLGSTVSTTSVPRKLPLRRSISLYYISLLTASADPSEIASS